MCTWAITNREFVIIAMESKINRRKLFKQDNFVQLQKGFIHGFGCIVLL